MSRKDIGAQPFLGDDTLPLAIPRVNKPAVELVIDDTLAMILQGVAELYQAHKEEISQTLEESAKKALVLNFKTDLDFSDSAPVINVGMRFSQSVTDRRTLQGEDPNQGQLALAPDDGGTTAEKSLDIPEDAEPENED